MEHPAAGMQMLETQNRRKEFILRAIIYLYIFQRTIHCCYGLGFKQYEKPWFHEIANETLIGVPEIILKNEKNYPAIKDTIWSIIGRTGDDYFVKQAAKTNRVQKSLNDFEKFPCDVRNARSKERPTNAHNVRLGDIDVIAAMGDSLSAANGAFASSLFQVMVENRGISFSIGGQGNWKKFFTLPNIIKEFNPKLIGYALGDFLGSQRGAQFNVAEPGAMSQDLPFMVRELVKRIRNDKRVDFKNDWKLVTLMIGSNNFCLDLCYHSDARKTVEMHKNDMLKTMQYLKDNMPRTIVNLVITPNLKVLVELKLTPYCDFLKLMECPCLFTIQHRPKRKLYYQVMSDWQMVEAQVADDARFKDKEDFVIISQPFTRNITGFPVMRNSLGMEEPVTDLTFMSQDCFHFSQKGYAVAANALWNNMLEPVGRKSESWDNVYEKFLCPSEQAPYIYTWKNSVTGSRI